MKGTVELPDSNAVREIVRENHGAAALTVLNGQGAASCGGNASTSKSSCCDGDAITGELYDRTEAATIPEDALLSSRGCCTPTALAALHPGEAALDLGSGGGVDALLSAMPGPCCGPECCAPEATATEAVTTTQSIAFSDRNSGEEATGTMKLSAFKALLAAHREKRFRIVLPNASAVPVCFHITEVAHIQKRFIDCGGRIHTTHTCQLQAWVWTDTEHRLMAGKIADVLNIANNVLPERQDLDVEIEYEDETLSQYPVTGYAVTNDTLTLSLGYKHTDCLAKDVCLPSMPIAASTGGGCCGPSRAC